MTQSKEKMLCLYCECLPRLDFFFSKALWFSLTAHINLISLRQQAAVRNQQVLINSVKISRFEDFLHVVLKTMI